MKLENFVESWLWLLLKVKDSKFGGRKRFCEWKKMSYNPVGHYRFQWVRAGSQSSCLRARSHWAPRGTGVGRWEWKESLHSRLINLNICVPEWLQNVDWLISIFAPHAPPSASESLSGKQANRHRHLDKHCLQVAIMTSEGVSWGHPYIRSLLTDNPPRPIKVGHTNRVYVPSSFWSSVLVLLRLTRSR